MTLEESLFLKLKTSITELESVIEVLNIDDKICILFGSSDAKNILNLSFGSRFRPGYGLRLMNGYEAVYVGTLSLLECEALCYITRE